MRPGDGRLIQQGGAVRRYVKFVALGAVSVFALAVAWLAWALNSRPSLEAYRRYVITGSERSGQTSGVRVVFLGVCTLLIDDGETAIMTDGFFTRPGLLRLAGRIRPDQPLIARSLERLGVRSLAAVIPAHSHYDHALDSPVVAEQTGAMLVGSASTANIGRGYGLPEDRIKTVIPGEPLAFGSFRVTFLESVHSPHAFYPGDIKSPVVPPARPGDYKVGDCYSVLIEHGGRTMLVQGSAGFVPGALQGRHADTVFLGVATLGKLGAAYQDAYWREVVQATGARRIVLVHWDDFWKPLDEPLVPMPRLMDNFDNTMRFLLARGREAGVEVRIPSAWASMDPFGS